MSRIDQLKAMLEDSPSDPDIHYMLAQEHAKAGASDAAVSAYDQCIALDPHYHYAYFHKAKALEGDGREQDAAAALREGLARAQAKSDAKAVSEIQTYLDTLE